VKGKSVRFLKLLMEKWNKELHLKTNQKVMQWQPIQIERGIFQGKSFLLLFYFTALTHELNTADFGYQVHRSERKISHLL
jgi:hypothetical protein